MSILIDVKTDQIYREFVTEFFKQVKFVGRRRDFNGTPRQRWAGKFGEAAVMKEIGLDLKRWIRAGFQKEKTYNRVGGDGGIDIPWDGVHIDVKTLITNMPLAGGISGMCCHNYKQSQAIDKKNKTDILICNYINRAEMLLIICGGISKAEIIDPEYSTLRKAGQKKKKEFGKGDHTYKATEYEVHQWQLVRFDKIQEMKGYIHAYAEYKKGNVHTFQRAKKKRRTADPEPEIHSGNEIFNKIHQGNGPGDIETQEGARI